MPEIADSLTILRVANGWVIHPGRGVSEFTHVATTPDNLADYVKSWAGAQLPTTGVSTKPMPSSGPLPNGT